MGDALNLTGERFGRLVAVRRTVRVVSVWMCQCDCGRVRKVTLGKLRSGVTRSCGCLKTDETRRRNFKHGMSGTRIYDIWGGMMKRCYSKNGSRYKDWGGRGIRVCERWHHFPNFLEDMKEGYASHLTLDRIDNDGNYEPSNCRWATVSMQNSNTRRTKH
jgi:hypothetical protein